MASTEVLISNEAHKAKITKENKNLAMKAYDVKVIDGSFSTQLQTHVKTENFDDDPLWTSRCLVTNPEAVFQTHLDYLRAGSDIIETNTYQASVTGFIKHLNITETESLNLIRSGVDLAKKAVAAYKNEIKGTVSNSNPLIAGSIGSYGASLHNGSEYTGNYPENVTHEMLVEWHKPRMKTLVEAGVNLLAIETIPSSMEAKALVELLKDFPETKAWISFSCRQDGKNLADGTSFKDIALQCYKTTEPGQLVAVGVNCIAPCFVTPLLVSIKEDKNEFVPLVAYPNSGEMFNKDEGWHVEQNFHRPEEYIENWLDLGVRYIGTCCRTSVADIKEIHQIVDSWKNKRMNTVKT